MSEEYKGWEEEDKAGTRELQSQRCLDMDWNIKKEITAWEMAYCIHHHDLNIDRVPEDRLQVVAKEIVKLQKEEKEEKEEKQERKAIESELARYKYPDNGNGKFFKRREFVEYYIDPDLFKTSLEAEVAMDELSHYYSKEATKTSEYNHEYRNAKYSRKIRHLQEAMDKVGQQYANLGGSESEFYKYITQIPLPEKGTLKEDTSKHREVIQEQLTDIGVSPTRANKIAKAITTKVYELLK